MSQKTIEEKIVDFMYENLGCNFGLHADKAKQMFDLYNEGFIGPRETSYTCSHCVDRVYRIMHKFVKDYEARQKS